MRSGHYESNWVGEPAWVPCREDEDVLYERWRDEQIRLDALEPDPRQMGLFEEGHEKWVLIVSAS